MSVELNTPRARVDEDQNLDRWSTEIELLLSEFGEIALCYSWLHSYSTRKYKAKYHRMSIPIIVLSTLTGTANFADSYVSSRVQTRLQCLCRGAKHLLRHFRYTYVFPEIRGDL